MAKPKAKGKPKAKSRPKKPTKVVAKAKAASKTKASSKAKPIRLTTPTAPPKRQMISIAPPAPRPPKKKEKPAPMADPDAKLAPPPPHQALANAHVAVATEAIYHLQESEPVGNPPTSEQIVSFAQRLFLTEDEIAAFLAAPNVPASSFADAAKVDVLAIARAFPPRVVHTITALGSPVKPKSFPPTKVAGCAFHVAAAASLASKLRAAAAYIEHAARRDAEALDKTARETTREVDAVGATHPDLVPVLAPLKRYQDARKAERVSKPEGALPN